MWKERQMSERANGCAFVVVMCGIVAMIGGWMGMVMGGLLAVVVL
jgi:hypothetical protein